MEYQKQGEATEKAEFNRAVEKVRRSYAKEGRLYKMIAQGIRDGNLRRGGLYFYITSRESEVQIYVEALRRFPGLSVRNGDCCSEHVFYSASHHVFLTWPPSWGIV